jgi:hypothetical protein
MEIELIKLIELEITRLAGYDISWIFWYKSIQLILAYYLLEITKDEITKDS